MNLHGIVSPCVAAVNPFTWGSVILAAGGYTTAADGSRTPVEDAPQTALMQVQALTQRDIMHLDGLGVMGSTHTVYINGRLEGLVRRDNKGGDLLQFRDRTWLVTAVLEDWPDWSKVAVTLQDA